MNETELLEALDRRARTAVRALDARLVDAGPAPLPEPPRRRRPRAPLLAVAGLVVVALVGAGLLLVRDDGEDGTVAGERDVVLDTDRDGLLRLALADPAALGLEIRAAFDGTTIEPPPDLQQPDVDYVAHGPQDHEDPWSDVVVSSTTPFDDQQFLGEVIDIGGPEATFQGFASMHRVLWRDGDVVRVLMSTRQDRASLVQVAADAVAVGWDGTGALPGHQILHVGSPEEFQLSLEFAASAPSPWRGIAYEDATGEQDFVIAWQPGTRRTLAALHALEPVRAEHVAAADVVISENIMGWGTRASWMATEGTVVQVVTYGDIESLLEEVIPALAPVSASEFEQLVRTHPPSENGVLLDRPETARMLSEDHPVVASLRTTDEAGNGYRLQVLDAPRVGLEVLMEIDTGSGTSGSGGPLGELVTPFLQAGGLSSTAPEGDAATPVVVNGVLPAGVPPDLASARFVDRTTGTEIEPLQVATGGIPSSDNRLVIALLDADPITARIDVTFQTADGEVTYRL